MSPKSYLKSIILILGILGVLSAGLWSAPETVVIRAKKIYTATPGHD